VRSSRFLSCLFQVEGIPRYASLRSIILFPTLPFALRTSRPCVDTVYHKEKLCRTPISTRKPSPCFKCPIRCVSRKDSLTHVVITSSFTQEHHPIEPLIMPTFRSCVLFSFILINYYPLFLFSRDIYAATAYSPITDVIHRLQPEATIT
jgi:hypothetical protein